MYNMTVNLNLSETTEKRAVTGGVRQKVEKEILRCHKIVNNETKNGETEKDKRGDEEKKGGERRCRLATSEGSWVWQMLLVMTICPEQQRCWTAGFKAAPSDRSKWSRGEDLWTKGCAERGARAVPSLYNLNLWWMRSEERSGGDK